MNLQKFAPIATRIAEVVDYMMIEEMGLMPPETYEVNERDERVYVTATFNPLALGRSLKAYENPDVARRLSSALDRMPVTITKRTGTHYVILLSGNLSLPKSVKFPGFGKRDVFRLGMGLKGEIALHANQLKNVIICAGQGAGKSNIQALLVHQARAFGWKLYLADPDGHTFNPDIWNNIAAVSVASSPADVLIILDRLAGEIADRVALFRKMAAGGIPPADIDEYNKVAEEPLSRIALSMDEANSYLGDKKIFGQLADLLRRGRKWGLHVFLSGHEWHKETVPAEVNDMFQTRIGLTVANEQASTIVLRSSRWGRWVIGKPAGRGILRTNQYQAMQFYLVTEEMEREWLGQGASTTLAAPLSAKEIEMVKYAVEHGGDFGIREVATSVDMTEWTVRKIAATWEVRGWLSKPQDAISPRRVTPKLADLAGISLTGSQASQDLIGHSQASQGLSQGLTGA